MKKNLIAALVASALISPIALADSPSFSYVEGGYSNGSLDAFDLTGFCMEGSVELGDNFFLTAEYAPLEAELGGQEADLDTSGVGVGFKSELSDSTSWFASYNMGSWDGDGGDIDVDTIRFGLRSQTSDKLELNGSIASVDFDGETETGFQVGMAYNTSETLQMTASFESVDEYDAFNVGLRLNF